jgi:ketosteroid isomerase-like protein
MTNSGRDARTPNAGQVAEAYFRAWKAKDFTVLRSLLADDVTFRGPLGTAEDAEGCMRGLQGMAQILTDIAVQHMFVDGGDVLTWFDLHTTLAPPCATANWSHVENGKITAIRVTFDARALAAAMGL